MTQPPDPYPRAAPMPEVRAENTPEQPSESQLFRLGASFPVEAYQQRQAPGGGPKLTYVSIDATINRLNEVLGAGWSTDGVTTYEKGVDAKGRDVYIAMCQLRLTANIDGAIKQAYGVGAMENGDLDMALKSALAEAIKKCGHQLGIALDLWNKDKREAIEGRMALSNASDAKHKAVVYNLAREATGKTKPTMGEVAAVFGRQTAEMTEPETNRAILVERGLL